MRRFFPLLLAAFSLTACETAVEIDLPEEEPRLVLNSLFQAGSLWAVGVSESQSVLSNKPLKAVTTATVEIVESGSVVETLTYEPERVDRPFVSPLYWGRRHRPEAGRTYTIRAAAPGFPTAEATAYVPPPLPLSVRVDRTQTVDTYFGAQDHEITVTFSDPAGTADYYALAVYRVIDRGSGDGAGVYSSIGFSSGDAVLRENRLVDDDFFEVDGDPFYDRAYFSDASIDGQAHTFKIRTSTYDEEGLDEQYFIVLQSLSSDFYEYLRTREISDYTGENPFAEPVSIHSNIQNGFGIFAGYATSMERFR